MSKCVSSSDCLFFESCQNSTRPFCPGSCQVSGWFIQVIIWSVVAVICVLLGNVIKIKVHYNFHIGKILSFVTVYLKYKL